MAHFTTSLIGLNFNPKPKWSWGWDSQPNLLVKYCQIRNYQKGGDIATTPANSPLFSIKTVLFTRVHETVSRFSANYPSQTRMNRQGFNTSNLLEVKAITELLQQLGIRKRRGVFALVGGFSSS